MKIIAFTKQKPELNHPLEDSYKYSKKNSEIVVAVADGITRDLVNNKYPNPSPAKNAADICCKIFIKTKSLEMCNKEIGKLNKKYNHNQDYLQNDFWACVGVGGVIKDYKLSYEFITDCGVAVFNKKGELKFRTSNECPNSKGSIDEDIKKRGHTSFKTPEGRKLIRSFYRNNPKNPLSYGALTGEKNAEHYIRKGESKLNRGDYVLFYSDGFLSIIYSEDFNISKQFNNLESYFDRNVGKIDGGEGTLVAVKLN